MTTHPKSLLAHIIMLPMHPIAFPWEHQDLARFSSVHRELLHHARLLSEVTYGAAILYNLMLAEVQSNEDWIEARRDNAKEWLRSLDRSALQQWSFDWVRPLAFEHQQVVSPQTLDFCEKWLGMICARQFAIRRSRRTRADTCSRNPPQGWSIPLHESTGT